MAKKADTLTHGATCSRCGRPAADGFASCEQCRTSGRAWRVRAKERSLAALAARVDATPPPGAAFLPIHSAHELLGYALVDEDRVADLVALGTWRAGSNGYICAWVSGRWLSLHHAVLGDVPPRGRVVDHTDSDPTNNCRSNLRVVSGASNTRRARARVDLGPSGFPGVSWHRATGKWHARLRVAGQRRSLGYFDDPGAAFCAYVQGRVEAFGAEHTEASIVARYTHLLQGEVA